jgi:hypothetical protein
LKIPTDDGDDDEEDFLPNITWPDILIDENEDKIKLFFEFYCWVFEKNIKKVEKIVKKKGILFSYIIKQYILFIILLKNCLSAEISRLLYKIFVIICGIYIFII